jgi:glutamine amidotransferase
MEVTLIDSPVANTANIARALRTVGAELRLTRDAAVIRRATKIVLPGVGSFRAAMTWVSANSIDSALRQAVSAGASLLGICVGHQLLFDSSDEMGTTAGLGLISGRVRRLASTLPVPQIGWNRVHFTANPLFEGMAPFYFVNSYAATDCPSAIATATYGSPFIAAVQRERVFGVQFHPEKSSTAGLQVLRNFVEKIR